MLARKPPKENVNHKISHLPFIGDGVFVTFPMKPFKEKNFQGYKFKFSDKWQKFHHQKRGSVNPDASFSLLSIKQTTSIN